MMTAFLRAGLVWMLLMVGETIHGIARTVWLAPVVGDFRARQIAVFTGSVVILVIAVLTIRWIRVPRPSLLVPVGLAWVVLTVTFEVGLGRLAGYSWDRIAADYNLVEGGLLPIGLVLMALAPQLAARLRGVAPRADNGPRDPRTATIT